MEKRRYKRFGFHVPVYISAGSKLFKKDLGIESTDVSAGGIAFETREKLPIDAATRVVIGKIGDFLQSAQIEGRVVYLRKNAAAKTYTVAIEFTDFLDLTREELLARLKEAEAKSGVA